MATVVKVDGVNVTSYVVEGSLKRAAHDLGGHTRVVSFKLRQGVTAIPDNDSYIEVTRTDGTTPDFRGLARMPSDRRTLNRKLEYEVTAVGWESLLDTIVITAAFSQDEGGSDVDALTSLLALYWAPIGTGVTHYLTSAGTLPRIDVAPGAITLRQFIDEMAYELGNVAWWIDPLKGLHWNDLDQLAPFAISDTPNGTTSKGYSEVERHRESMGRRVRVRVVGTGVEYTATDWDAWAALNAKRSAEASTPAERFPQLPDVIELNLTTTAECQQLAFRLLAAEAARETFLFKNVEGEGLEIGQRVDVFDTLYGTGTAPHPFLAENEVLAGSATMDLDSGMGRFLITKVTPIEKTEDTWRWDVEVGDPELILAAQMSRGNA